MKRSLLGKVLIIFGVIILVIISFTFIRSIIVKKIYPLKYEDEIKTYSDEFNVDPYLVASIIWVESKYDPAAISQSGAVGLMQIMPETGAWVAAKIDLDTYKNEELKNADINIKIGCWYLSYLDERFGGEITHILAAYNGGPNRVAEWLDSEEYADDRKLINIPFKETDDYVRRVNAAFKIYTTYYTFE